MSSKEDFNMSTNEKLLRLMFMQFLKTQASEPASQAINIKLECTPVPEVFTGKGFSIEQIYKRLETFRICFNLKINFNLDYILTP